MAAKSYKFTAEILSGDGGGAGILFPYDVEKEFGTRGRVPVKATFDGIPYSGSLIKYGSPAHMLPILKGIREQLGKKPGDTVEVVLAKDETERTVAVPEEFARLLKKEKVLEFFEGLSYSHRKEYVRWITEAKKEETRRNRLAKAVEMLRAKVKTPG